MGTNYYWLTGDDERGEHIGKTSAAGAYCWDCGVTLCKNGVSGIHTDQSDWHDACPRCGKAKDDDKVKDAAMHQLGLRRDQGRRTGVGSCCSFRWAIEPAAFGERCTQNKLGSDVIIDEYGETYTEAEFVVVVLGFAPIEFTDSIGQVFS